MTFQEFERYQDSLLDKVISVGTTKGREYVNNSEDRFANFNHLSTQLDLTNIQVGWVYLAKHLEAIATYCRTGESYSTEPIEGRIVDAITYLTLIAGMIKESTPQESV